LVLCCDGVWEGINSSNISQDLVNQFNKRVRELVNSGKTPSEARKIAAQEFFGQVFFQLNLGGDIGNLNPVYLTRKEVTDLSGDNATAVVVKF
jgi:hypothetical protein